MGMLDTIKGAFIKEPFEDRVFKLFEKYKFEEKQSTQEISEQITHAQYIITRKGSSYFDKDKTFLITLVDSPSGIPLDFADHAFEEYNLVHETRKLNANLVICRYKNRDATRKFMDKFEEVKIVNFKNLDNFLEELTKEKV
jgi:hypothetical protein